MNIRSRLDLGIGILALVLAPNVAPAAETGWSLGVGWGDADYGVTAADFDDGSITSGRVDSNELGWKVYVGYSFNEHLAIEAGYVDLLNDFDGPTFEGTSDGTGSLFTSFPDGSVSFGLAPEGYFVDGVGRLPLGGRWAALGRVGALFWQAETTTRDLLGVVADSDSGSSLHLGTGLEYRLRNGLGVRGEYEVFTGIRRWDVDLFTAGVSYSF